MARRPRRRKRDRDSEPDELDYERGPGRAEQLNNIVRGFLSTIVELSQLPPERRPPAEIAHREIRELLESTVRESGKVGLPPEDQQDLRFALVAFADEMMQVAPGRFQEFWTSHLLQEQFFDESLAGEAFFDRLSQIRADTKRRPLLLVYYLCMLFGYRGRYRTSAQLEFEDLLDDVQADLRKGIGLGKKVDLAPLGERPDDLAADGRRNFLLQTLAISVAVLSVLFYIGLWLVVDDEAADLHETLRDQHRQLTN